MQPDDRKLEELVLYLCSGSESDRSFGLTKLNKLLFYCDFLAYRAWGRSITGHPYARQQHGPCAKHLTATLDRMKEEGVCAEAQARHFGLTQRRIVALRPAEVATFEPDEVRLIDEVLEEFKFHNATEISNLSHKFIGWRIADPGGDIPYDTVFIEDPRPLTASEERTCLQAARELGFAPA